MIKKIKKCLALNLSLITLSSFMGSFNVYGADDKEEVKYVGDSLPYLITRTPSEDPSERALSELRIGDEPRRGSSVFSSLCSQRTPKGLLEIILQFLTHNCLDDDPELENSHAFRIIPLNELKDMLLAEGKINPRKLDLIIPNENIISDATKNSELDCLNQDAHDVRYDENLESCVVAGEGLSQDELMDIVELLNRNDLRLSKEDALKLTNWFYSVPKKISEQKETESTFTYSSGGSFYRGITREHKCIVPAIGEKSDCISDVIFSHLIGLRLHTGEDVWPLKRISLEEFYRKYLNYYSPSSRNLSLIASNLKYGYNTFFKLNADGFNLSSEDATKVLRSFWYDNANTLIRPSCSVRDFKNYIELKYKHPNSPGYLTICKEFEDEYLSRLSGKIRPKCTPQPTLHPISWDEFQEKYLSDNEFPNSISSGTAGFSEYISLLDAMIRNGDFLSEEDSHRFTEIYLKLYKVDYSELEGYLSSLHQNTENQ